MAGMHQGEHHLVKHREIYFCSLHPDSNQAQSAMLALGNVRGILHLHLAGPHCLRVSYHIQHVTLRLLEQALADLGFHLDNSLLVKLKRALYYYTEEVQRENLGCAKGSTNCTQKIFINRYQRRKHGCRDGRPDHWRRYL